MQMCARDAKRHLPFTVFRVPFCRVVLNVFGYAIDFIRFIYAEIPLDSMQHASTGLLHIRVPALLRRSLGRRTLHRSAYVRTRERAVRA